jgi:hypothetical protein
MVAIVALARQATGAASSRKRQMSRGCASVSGWATKRRTRRQPSQACKAAPSAMTSGTPSADRSNCPRAALNPALTANAPSAAAASAGRP